MKSVIFCCFEKFLACTAFSTKFHCCQTPNGTVKLGGGGFFVPPVHFKGILSKIGLRCISLSKKPVFLGAVLIHLSLRSSRNVTNTISKGLHFTQQKSNICIYYSSSQSQLFLAAGKERLIEGHSYVTTQRKKF